MTPSEDDMKAKAADHLLSALTETALGTRLFCMIDSARNPYTIPHLVMALTRAADCLFSGNAKQELGDQTAWVADVTDDRATLEALLDEGYGKGMLSFAFSALDLRAFITHLKKFTKIRDAKGTEHFFRFYDPKVMRQYVPVFNETQHKAFFAGLTSAMFEDTRDPAKLIRFWSERGSLRNEIADLAARLPAGVPPELEEAAL